VGTVTQSCSEHCDPLSMILICIDSSSTVMKYGGLGLEI